MNHVAHHAWIEAAAIAAVVILLYFAFIFRNFVWTRTPQTIRTIAVATWGRATKRHAAVSTTPPETAAPSYFMDSIDWSFPR